MKKMRFLLILVLHFCFFYSIDAQTNCGSSAPFCANQGAVSFPAGVNNGSAAAGPDYGCLFSQPNPAWYYFQVSQTGPIIIGIAGTGGSDVDFICWGPFTSPTGNCNNLTAGNTVDCSYSASATETCTINNATVGQYYTLLLTNFSNQVQNITFSQSSGTGATNCGLLSSGVTSQSICAGAPAILTANSNIVNPSYLWTPGGATTPSISVSPGATTIYSVSISGTNPATGTATTVVNSGTVTILASSTPTASSNSPLCPGATLNLSTSASTTYTWSGPGGFSSSIQSPSVANITSALAGVYSVSVTNASGCLGTTTVNVSLGSAFSPTLSSNGPLCAGATLSLTATSGATSYTWTGPGGYSSTSQNPVIPMATASGIYTLTTTGVPCLSINTISVTIIPAISVALPAIPTVCSNGTLNLNGPSGGTSYAWAGPNSFTSSLQNPSISNMTLINQGVYSLSVTVGSCLNTGTVGVTVYNPLSFATSPTPIVFCEGKSGILNSNGLGGTSSYNYSWSPTTGLTSPNSPSTLASGSVTTTYTLTLTDVNCPVTFPATVTVLATVNSLPQITMSTSNARGCEPFCTDLISSSVPASTNCIWKFSNNTSAMSCNQNPFCFPVHGVYNASLTVIDINGCVDSISQNSFIIVDPKPFADFSWNPGNPTILVNDVGFYDESTVGLPMQSWSWNFGDYSIGYSQDTSNVQNPYHLYNNVGTYPVTLQVTNVYGCRDSITKILDVEDEFALYIPNAFSPTNIEGKNDVFNVQGMGFLSDNFEMSIYDRWGNLIFKTNDVYKGWDGSVKGGPVAPQGVYVYKIKLKDFKRRDKEFVGHITVL